jgi:DNA integrity scanning protein DisA with diadenylate cyclase activity
VGFVARLAAIDGAVIIDTALTIYGFGAMLRKPESPSLMLEERNPVTLAPTELKKIAKSGGARHQSAAAWCVERSGKQALVFTVSEDGMVSLFAPLSEDPFVGRLKPLTLRV